MEFYLILAISIFLIVGIVFIIFSALLISGIIFNINHLKRKKYNSQKASNYYSKMKKIRDECMSDEARVAYERAQSFIYFPFTDESIPQLRYCGERVQISGYCKTLLQGEIFCAEDVKKPFEPSIKQFSSNIKGHKWVIAVHGHRSSGKELAKEAFFFMERGFNVLLPDLRGHGGSAGNYAGMGWHDSLDLEHWIHFLIQRDPSCQIILYGQSMGGTAVILASGSKLPSNVKLIIDDCGFTNFLAQAKYLCEKDGAQYHPFLMRCFSKVCKLLYGYKYENTNALKAIRNNSTIPTLFIHGTLDHFVPHTFSKELYAAATVLDKELLLVENAGHTLSMTVDFCRYWDAIDRFIVKTIV